MSSKTISQKIQSWSFGGSFGTLKIYATEPFHTSGGGFIIGGKVGSPNLSYDAVTCSVSGGNITIPEIEIDSTDDSRDCPDVRFNAVLYDDNDTAVQELLMNFVVPHAISNPTTWDALAIYGQSGETLPAIEYQPTLVSGTTIKTVNSTTLLGAGDVAVQPTLISGTNIKTVNGDSILGSGDLVIVGEQKLSSYTDLADAVSSIGATKTVLHIDAASTVSTAVTIPATLFLNPLGSLLTKSGSGTIAFGGIGLSDPESQSAIFSGFNVGDVTWSGSVFPAKVSASLWATTSVSGKINRADAAFLGKQVTVVAYPGVRDSQITVTEGHALYLTRGNYTSTYTLIDFVLESNTRLYGDGQGQTFIVENATTPQLLRASGVVVNPFDDYNENITVEDITFYGNPSCPVDASQSAVFLGNCTNGTVRRCTFDHTHGFAAYCGGASTSGFNAQNIWFVDNLCIGLQTQFMGTVGGRNIHISRNTFIVDAPSTATFIAVIDIEPNSGSDGSENIFITDNIMDGRMAQSGWNGIAVQRAFGINMRNVVVARNQIIGFPETVNTFQYTDVNTAANTISVYGHSFDTGQPVAILRDDSGSGGSLPDGLGTRYRTLTSFASNTLTTDVAHGYGKGSRIRFLGGTTLPTGLLTLTDYYVATPSGSTLKLASSYANAIAGTTITWTGSETGTWLIVPQDDLAVIRIDSNTVKIAVNTTQAAAGNAIDITSQGADVYLINPTGRLANGISAYGENIIVENNFIHGAQQVGIDIGQSLHATIRNNKLVGTGGTGHGGLRISDCADSDIYNNVLLNSAQNSTQSTAIVEEESLTYTVSTTMGSPIITATAPGLNVIPWYVRGLTLTIGGSDYVIRARTGVSTIVLQTNALATLAGVAATLKSSSNRYWNNNAPLGITLVATGTSEILSEAAVVHNVADADYTAVTGTIVYTSLTSGRTVTLPDATTCRGKEITVKDGAGSAATNNITLDGNGAQTIDGVTTKPITTNYGSLKVKSNGSNWVSFGDGNVTGSGNAVLATSPTLTTPAIGVATGTSLATTGLIKSSGTAGVGYATGAGGTVAQSTDKSTTVVLDKICGAITCNNANLAAATVVSFTLTNSTIAATDVLILNHISGGTIGSYTLNAQCGAGSATINIRNNTAGGLAEALVIQYAVIKSVSA